MSIFTRSSVVPAIVGAVVGTIALTALPSQAGTITGVSLTGLGQNTGTSSLVGNQISVTETFNNTNTITKALTVSNGGSGTYSFVVNALNASGQAWDRFRFNLNATGGNRPQYASIS
jgi:hypothetical protein